jgi:hypothetical protein
MACGAKECWCTTLPKVIPLPNDGAKQGCWCPACLKAEIESRACGAAKTADIPTIGGDVQS